MHAVCILQNLTLSEALSCATSICQSERLIHAALACSLRCEPAGDRILCYDYSFQTTQESVRVRAYFAPRTEAGQNQGNHPARRPSPYFSWTIHAHRRDHYFVCGSRLWLLAILH